MERIVQYLDDLDDLVYGVPLVWEKIRQLFSLLVTLGLFLFSLVAGIYLALVSPPLAVAAASILLVALLYRGAVQRSANYPASA